MIQKCAYCSEKHDTGDSVIGGIPLQICDAVPEGIMIGMPKLSSPVFERIINENRVKITEYANPENFYMITNLGYDKAG